jgi:hypothetical protein
MLHSIKMIREYYPRYNDHKIAVISPCIANAVKWACPVQRVCPVDRGEGNDPPFEKY